MKVKKWLLLNDTSDNKVYYSSLDIIHSENYDLFFISSPKTYN